MNRHTIFSFICLLSFCTVLFFYNLPEYWTQLIPSTQTMLKDYSFILGNNSDNISSSLSWNAPLPYYARDINGLAENSTDQIKLNITKSIKDNENIPTIEDTSTHRNDKHQVDTEPNLKTSMTTVAIGCAITSNKLEKKMDFKHSTKDAIKKTFPIFKSMAPSFCKTATAGYSYHFFIAYDSQDVFFSEAKNKDLFLETLQDFIDVICVPRHIVVSIHTVICSHTHKPAWAQNDAMLEAYLYNMDYYYRINDDSVLSTPGWTEVFIKILKGYNPPNVGVVGPMHQGGNTGILTYDFVHRSHLDMFGFYYPRAFTGKCIILFPIIAIFKYILQGFDEFLSD